MIKQNSKGVDVEAKTKIVHNDVTYEFSNKVNPGTDSSEEYNIWLTNEEGALVKLGLGKGCHPHESIGVFLEDPNGNVTKLENSYDPKSSYAYQAEMCEGILKTLVSGGTPKIPHQWNTLDYQIYLLEIIDRMKE